MKNLSKNLNTVRVLTFRLFFACQNQGIYHEIDHEKKT